MNIEANSPEEYISQLPEDRKMAMMMLRKIINENLPIGFKETMSYGMVSYVIPHSIYPSGYHCNPKDPVPFISIASQKNYIAVYHMGIYIYPEILSWFREEYSKNAKTKLDMGKSCIRFKKVDDIPYDLIAELSRKITVEDFLERYQDGLKIIK
ncbi:MAG: hypothetical protein K0S01_970 [Herbinix sp.]|jgi:uncharacterized protein YdhG (YjbR/CyaY superfamily)|nr:hypothetical protein [Herbinix sp.]